MSAIVTRDGKAAQRVDPSGVPEEAFLQEYILANPQALPLSELREDLKLLIVAREFSTANGPIDALGLDDDGNLYVIETKLYRNHDKRRVLAQVLDYGAALWRRHGDPRSFRDQLENAARRTKGQDLREAVSDAFEIEAEEAEALLKRAVTHVSQGEFRFVILMDKLDDPLKDLISFINENSRFDVFGVELEFYRFDGYEVTFPKLYGAEARKEVSQGSSTRRRWNEESYFEDVAERFSQEQSAAFRQLYDFARGHADHVTWGTGTTVGSFNLKYERIHPTKSLLTVYSSGSIDLNFAWLHEPDQPLPREVQRLAQLLDRLDHWELGSGYADTFQRLGPNVWIPQLERLIEALKISLDPAEPAR